MLQLLKSASRKLYYLEDSVRTSHFGPYKGIRFQVSPILNQSRMCVFYTAYEAEVAAHLQHVVKPGMTVLNIGAHIGIHALYIAKLLEKNGVVYAFEPWPENAAALRRNIEINRDHLARIEHVPSAVSDAPGRHLFTRGKTDGTHHLAEDGETGDIDVETTTVDAFCIDHVIKPSLALIDVEGKELAVLKGAERTISHCKPRLIIEHHGNRFTTSVMDWLKAAGYNVTDLGSRHIYAE